MSCCTECTNDHFGEAIAQRDVENYKKKGPKKSTTSLLHILKRLDLTGMHLLDIGAGIGVLSNELRENGLSEITHNDISSAYLNAFRSEIGDHLNGIKINSLKGDFVEVADKIESADIVVLDKSICCYPHYNELVQASASKAKTWYAYVIPRDKWWVKIVHYFGELRKTIKGDEFKSFIYPVDKIEEIVLDYGFTKHTQVYQREWLIAVFKK